MTEQKKTKAQSQNKTKDEIEIENKDLLNVFFDNSGSQFESQFFYHESECSMQKMVKMNYQTY